MYKIVILFIHRALRMPMYAQYMFLMGPYLESAEEAEAEQQRKREERRRGRVAASA